MARLLVLSLLRTRFNGEIVVFKNSSAPLFSVPRRQVREILIATHKPRTERFWDYAQSWKFRVHEHLDVHGYNKVLFLDADCLVLRSLRRLLAGNWDLAFYPEPGSSAASLGFNAFISTREARRLKARGINGGILAVRAKLYHEVMAEWERIHLGPAPRRKVFTDQAALTRLVIDSRLRKRRLTRAELMAPFTYDKNPSNYFGANIVHLAGCRRFPDKLRFMFGLYLNTFFFDPQASLLSILDS